MWFIRGILAALRLAYVPKIGRAYHYASNGPFDLGPVLIPREIKQGFVRYEMEVDVGTSEPVVTQHAASIGTFASMCRES